MVIGKDYYRNIRKVNEEIKIFINKFNISKFCFFIKNLIDLE